MTRRRRRDLCRDPLIRAEADVHGELHGQAPGQQGGSDDERDGGGYLDRDEHTETSAGHAADASSQPRSGRTLARSRRAQGRQRAGSHGSHQ